MAEKNKLLKIGGLAFLAFVLLGSSSGKVTTKHGAINNPGNIRNEPKIYPGEITSPSDAFLSFSTLVYGYAAMIEKLRSYFNSGYITLRQMIHHWAPEADNNDPEAYTAYIIDNLGEDALIDPDAPVPVYNDDTLAAIIALMANVEQGKDFGINTWTDIQNAFKYFNSYSNINS